MLISTVYGTTSIPATDGFRAVVLGTGLADGDISPLHPIVFDLRMPRALLAAVIGAVLGLVAEVERHWTDQDERLLRWVWGALVIQAWSA
ncbi:hypothetical protein [Ruegeria denitrificans]|uniref:hypothetical protein n=1 Tax=Ruegeria denitrificans TaxID=1715692 RepID=UPI00071C9209|nr:hypothetical protein [Ruegeria denitrificans]